MGKKDKKSKAAEQKARVAAKQNKKAAQKEKKTKSKGAEDSDSDDVDLQTVLEEYSRQVGVLCIDHLSVWCFAVRHWIGWLNSVEGVLRG